MKTISISDFLTPAQIRFATDLWRASTTPAKSIRFQVIDPNLKAIEKKLNQEMDPGYLSYLVEHLLNQTETR